MRNRTIARIVLPLLSLLSLATPAPAQKDPKPPALAEVKYAKTLAYAQDGSLVLINYKLAGDGKSALGVWDTKSGEFKASLDKSTHDWDRVAVSPDGKKAVAISVGSNEFKLWDIASGKQEETQKLPKW